MFRIYLDNHKLHIPDMNNRRKVPSATLNQELNKAGSFNFALPPEHFAYSSVKNLKSIVTVFDDNTQIFKGRVLNHSFDFYNRKTVIAEGELAYFNDSVYQASSKGSFNTSTLIPDIINNHNSQVDDCKKYRVGDIDSAFVEIQSLEFFNSMSFLQDEVIKQTNGYLSVRYQGDDRFVDFKLNPGKLDDSTKIKFGVNLIDLNKYINPADLYTCIIPYGEIVEGTEKPLDIRTVNGGINFVENTAGINSFGRIFRQVEFKGITDAVELYKGAVKFANSVVAEAVTLDLTAIELRRLGITNAYEYGVFQIGNSYKVISLVHGINEYFLCSKKSTSLFEPEKNKVLFGHTRKLLTDYI